MFDFYSGSLVIWIYYQSCFHYFYDVCTFLHVWTALALVYLIPVATPYLNHDCHVYLEDIIATILLMTECELSRLVDFINIEFDLSPTRL